MNKLHELLRSKVSKYFSRLKRLNVDVNEFEVDINSLRLVLVNED